MPKVTCAPLPAGALLESYASAGAYTDCFVTTINRTVSHAQFVEAFYTSPVFRVERWLIAAVLFRLSTDLEARKLASGKLDEFAAWTVENRTHNQIILVSGRTRSWFMTLQSPITVDSGENTVIYFGSAIVPHARTGRLGWQYSSLLGFHKLYSRVLLWSTKRRLEH